MNEERGTVAAAYEQLANVLTALAAHVQEQPPPAASPDYVEGLRDGVRAAINLSRGMAASMADGDPPDRGFVPGRQN